MTIRIPRTIRSKQHRQDVKDIKRMMEAREYKQTVYEMMTEKHLQENIIRAAKLHGWRVWFTWKSFHSPKGEFDLRMVRPPRYIVMEAKKEKGRLTPEQRESYQMLKQCPGIETYVVRPSDFDSVLEILK